MPTPKTDETDPEIATYRQPADGLTQLEAHLHGREAGQIAPALPRDAAETRGVPDTPAQKRFADALVERLHRLGYIRSGEAAHVRALAEQSPGRALNSDACRAAVHLFQREAGLAVDGWPGPQTWDALQAYFAFEGARAELGRRLRPGADDWRARLRGALLRLDILGLTHEAIGAAPLWSVSRLNLDASCLPQADTPASRDTTLRTLNQALEGPLSLFDYSLDQLGLPGAGGTRRELVDRVLAYDSLVTALTRPLETALPEPRMDRPAHADPGQILHGFIARILHVEMWLNDFLPSPGAARSALQDRQQQSDLVAALTAFLRQFRKGETRKLASRSLLTVDGEAVRPEVMARHYDYLFPSILSAVSHLLNQSAGHERINEELAQIAEEDPKFVETIHEESRSLRSKLWDGIRRVIGWVGGFINRIRKLVRTLVQRLARIVFAFSVEAINMARDALRVIGMGITHFTQRQGGDDQGALSYVRDLDFDYRICLDPAQSGRARHYARWLTLRARAFNHTAQFLAGVVGEIITILRNGVLTGWIAVGLALLRLSRRARELARWLGEARDLAAHARFQQERAAG